MCRRSPFLLIRYPGVSLPSKVEAEAPTVDYFKQHAEETGIPYQTLINLYA